MLSLLNSVIDTNVLVSALIRQSFPYLIINQVISSNDLKLCFCRGEILLIIVGSVSGKFNS